MERKKLLILCAASIAAAVLVISLTIGLLNMPAAAPSTSDVVVSGQVTCLPHKGEGPQTMECAFGVRTDDNRFYALQDVPEGKTLEIGKRVEVRGSLNTATESVYAIAGTITVKEIAQ